MCNTLVFTFMCIKNTLTSDHGLKNEVYYFGSWIKERGIFMCNTLVFIFMCIKTRLIRFMD